MWHAALIDLLEPRVLFAAPTVWQSRGPGGGGAFFSPSFNPNNSSELYVASDMSGVYHSTNLGQSWSLVDFHQLEGNRPTQVQYTNEANILYAIDDNEGPGGDDISRIAKSTDGGVHWSPTAMNWDTDNSIYSLYADPSSTQNFIFSDYNNVYFSNDGGATFSSKFSTTSGQGVYVAGAFFDGSNIYVGTNQGLLVSTNSGSTFSVSPIGGIPAGQVMFSFAGAKQNGTTRFFCVTLKNADVFPGADIEDSSDSYQGIYSLDVGQTSWTAKTTGIAGGDFPAFVSMARNNISTVYVAGSNENAPIVYKTTNAGSQWNSVLNTASNGNVATGWQGAGGDRDWSYGQYALSFEVSPTDPNIAAFTDLGFVHLTSDGGTSWRQAYVNPADQNPAGANTPTGKAYRGVGLEDTSVHSLTWINANTMYAGYTDIVGVRSTDGGQSWAFPAYNPRQNTIYDVAQSPATGALYAASSKIHDIYQSTYLTDARINPAGKDDGQLLISTDNGATWSTLHDFGHPVIWVAVDPTNTNRAYVSVVSNAAGGIFMTTDLNDGMNSQWTAVAAPPRTEGHPFNIRILNDGSLVASYSARRNSSGAFTASSGVFYSTDHGTTWSDRTDTALTGMEYWTKDVVIDPTDPTQHTWWAAVRSGFGGTGNGMGGLYKTIDSGAHWTRVFSTDSVESVAINSTTKEMYVATLASGVWYCPDVTAATPSFAQTDYPFRQPERIFINPFNTGEIWVASFGYGLSVGTTAVQPKVTGQTFNYLQKPNAVQLTFSPTVPSDLDSGDITLKNLKTNTTFTSTITPTPATDVSLTFPSAPNGILPDGNYTLTISAAGVSGLGSDYTFNFFALAGDADHDGTVNVTDLGILASHWQQTGMNFSQGDFNYDGTVNVTDLGIFASNWQQTINLAPPVMMTTTNTRKASRVVTDVLE